MNRGLGAAPSLRPITGRGIGLPRRSRFQACQGKLRPAGYRIGVLFRFRREAGPAQAPGLGHLLPPGQLGENREADPRPSALITVVEKFGFLAAVGADHRSHIFHHTQGGSLEHGSHLHGFA